MNGFCTRTGHAEQYDSVPGGAGSKSDQAHSAELQLWLPRQEQQQLHLPQTPHSVLTITPAVKLFLFFSYPLFFNGFILLLPLAKFNRGLGCPQPDEVMALRDLACRAGSRGLRQASPRFMQSQVWGYAVPGEKESYQDGELQSWYVCKPI